MYRCDRKAVTVASELTYSSSYESGSGLRPLEAEAIAGLDVRGRTGG